MGSSERAGGRASVLPLVQRGLERLYRIETAVAVEDFVIDEGARALFQGAGGPREQLLVAEREGDLELALYVDERVLANLAANDPRAGLGDHNLQDFLFTVEGVSHFVYVVWRARSGRPVSALELELQAEIDKYVACLLTMHGAGGAPPDLRRRLFDDVSFLPGLAPDERERYRVANTNARAYAASLDERYVARQALPDMLAELRRFYRLGVQDKLAHIAQAA